MINFEHNFSNHGYCEGPTVINKNEILDLRSKLENCFKLKNYPTIINLFDIDDENLIKSILNIFSNKEVNKFVLALKNFFKEEICVLPNFLVHRNYHVDRVKSPGIGWHRDCGGELEYKYCKKNLISDYYFFGKLAIYLQENSEYGGSIDVIPNSHTHLKFNNYFLRKIKGSKLFFLIKFQKYLSFLYRLIPENFFMKILKAKTLQPKIGSLVLFDSRIVHRGTPISDSVRNNINFDPLNYSAKELPLNKIKFSLYVEIGNSLGLDSYLYDRNRRVNQKKKEIQNLEDNLEKLNTYNPELANKIKQVFYTVMKKYI